MSALILVLATVMFQQPIKAPEHKTMEPGRWFWMPTQQNMYTYYGQGETPRQIVYDNRVFNFPEKGRVRFSDIKRDTKKQKQIRWGWFMKKEEERRRRGFLARLTRRE